MALTQPVNDLAVGYDMRGQIFMPTQIYVFQVLVTLLSERLEVLKVKRLICGTKCSLIRKKEKGTTKRERLRIVRCKKLISITH